MQIRMSGTDSSDWESLEWSHHFVKPFWKPSLGSSLRSISLELSPETPHPLVVDWLSYATRASYTSASNRCPYDLLCCDPVNEDLSDSNDSVWSYQYITYKLPGSIYHRLCTVVLLTNTFKINFLFLCSVEVASPRHVSIGTVSCVTDKKTKIINHEVYFLWWDVLNIACTNLPSNWEAI